MNEPINEPLSPNQPSSSSSGPEPCVPSLFTPLSPDSGLKWGRMTALLVLILGGLAWGLGWLEPLANWASPTLREVRGTILYNGKPVTKGFVRTIHESRGVMGTLGPINADGTFELTTNDNRGAYSGRHRVVVLCMDGGFPPKSILPERYTEPQTSPLLIQVSRSGPNQVQLELVDAPVP